MANIEKWPSNPPVRLDRVALNREILTVPDDEKIFFSIFNERRKGEDRRVLVLDLKDKERRSEGNQRRKEYRRRRQREEFHPRHVKLAVLAAWLDENCKGNWYIGSSSPDRGNYRVGFDNSEDLEKFTVWRGIKSSLKQTDNWEPGPQNTGP